MKRINDSLLLELIEENNSESINVDFKQQWHDNNAKLVHDILCLCNADYNGDRFILFGVNDDAQIIGVNQDKKRKDNATLINLIRDSQFNRLPEIDIYTLNVHNLKIDIIQIKNEQYKPYFLLKDKSESKITVRNGIIYSRNGSANTPINNSATESEIEKMWRERFGLDQSPTIRIKNYLMDFENWFHNDEYYFYQLFPEFSINEENNSSHILDCNQEWLRGEIDCQDSNKRSAFRTLILYHQTCLVKIHCVQFGRKIIVAPSWKPVGAGRFYYYVKNTIEYAYQMNRAHFMGNNYSLNLQYDFNYNSNNNFSIPVFNNENELENFIQNIDNGINFIKPTSKKSQQLEIWYDLLEKYKIWREEN